MVNVEVTIREISVEGTRYNGKIIANLEVEANEETAWAVYSEALAALTTTRPQTSLIPAGIQV